MSEKPDRFAKINFQAISTHLFGDWYH